MNRSVAERSSSASTSPRLTPAELAAPFSGACWRDVVSRREALPGLDARVLLHAGPPIVGGLPAPLRVAAVQALLFEHLAGDVQQAHAMLAAGDIELRPAQDHGMVTPLAHVVSASMPVAVVGNADRVMYAPLIEGPPPALRFGAADAACRARLLAIAALGVGRLAPRLRASPIALAPVIEQALAAGDECHGRTAEANAALVAALSGVSMQDLALLAANPGFVLPLLMAAAGWLLAAQARGISAVGGNGIQFGYRVHRGRAGMAAGIDASDWRVVSAQAPVGIRLPGREQAMALGAIGDSAVIDFCGLGGQAMHLAPLLLDEWRELPAAEPLARRRAVIDPLTGIVDVERILASGMCPQVNLAILDANALEGLLGRGFYQPPASLFAPA